MDKFNLILKLNEILRSEMPQYESNSNLFQNDENSQRQLLRSLMNLRIPNTLTSEFITYQDQLLVIEKDEKGIVELEMISTILAHNILLWRGDITLLKVDAIVNAANNGLVGCFHPQHHCIDNAIHSASGLQLREACSQISKQRSFEDYTGKAFITKGYNLPSKYVIHTVGPIIFGNLREVDCIQLESCYSSCLELAIQKHLESIAFCCVSTGEYHFPAEEAARIAITTVRAFQNKYNNRLKVIFNVYKESDERIYRKLLASNS